MSYGDGSITEVKRKDGTSYAPKHWKIYFYMGNGKKPRTKTIKGTKAEARKERDKIRAEMEGGLSIKADTMTFRMLADEWLQARKDVAKVQERRLKTDQSQINVLCELIGDILIKDIDIRMVENLIPAVRKSRLDKGFRCSNTTLRNYFVTLKAILRRGVQYDYIFKNPCDFIENIPSPNRIDRHSLTADEAARLLKCIDVSEKHYITELLEKERRQREWCHDKDRSYMLGISEISCTLIARIGLATGMRLSEILNLTWSDMKDDVITVKRSTTKTESGARRISLDADTLSHIHQWKALQAHLMASLGIELSNSHTAFCTNKFTRMDVQNFKRWWNKWKAENGFPDLLFHELRHTHATQLLGNGIDIKTVQTRLGHSDPSLTLKYYAHAMPNNDQAAADLMGEILRGKRKQRPRIIEVKTA